jgi:hypothetical protein
MLGDVVKTLGSGAGAGDLDLSSVVNQLRTLNR